MKTRSRRFSRQHSKSTNRAGAGAISHGLSACYRNGTVVANDFLRLSREDEVNKTKRRFSDRCVSVDQEQCYSAWIARIAWKNAVHAPNDEAFLQIGAGGPKDDGPR